MLNTLYDEDNLIIDKVSYRFRDPERYEIIVFPYRYAEETFGREVIRANRYGQAAEKQVLVF